jgi:transcriptional regulator with XRE-family HTH domain
MQTTTGLDLKVERVRSRVTAVRLAAAMGVSRQRVSQVESLDRAVSPDMQVRYREALLSLTGALANAQEGR